MEDLEKLAKCKRGDVVYVPRYNYGAIERHHVESITVKKSGHKEKENSISRYQYNIRRKELFFFV